VPKRDPHDILGVERGAGMAAVKAAWRKLARAHHPDLTGSDAAAVRAATARMAEINAAYDLIRQLDAEGRAGIRDGASAGGERAQAGGTAGTEAPPRRTAGPPRPRPTRPVTGRVDTSDTFRPRNTTFGPGIRMGRAGTPPRARPADRQPPRASDPTGPTRSRRAESWTPPPEPALEEAQALELKFGKFHGHSLGEVADFEPSYIDWLAATISHDPDVVAAARVIRRRLDELGIRRRTRPPRRPIISAD
jgi:curved DNA-binding protein CbpA